MRVMSRLRIISRCFHTKQLSSKSYSEKMKIQSSMKKDKIKFSGLSEISQQQNDIKVKELQKMEILSSLYLSQTSKYYLYFHYYI